MNKGKKIRGFLFASACIIGISTGSYIESNYSKEAIVTKVEDSTITAIDKNGYEWTISNKKKNNSNNIFNEKDVIKMFIYNNHTDTIITDDVVKKIKKIK